MIVFDEIFFTERTVVWDGKRLFLSVGEVRLHSFRASSFSFLPTVLSECNRHVRVCTLLGSLSGYLRFKTGLVF